MRNLAAAAIVLAAGAAVSADEGVALPAATEQLTRLYPGTQVLMDQGRVRAIYGKPMTPGINPKAAADWFLSQHVGALGAGNADLRPIWSADLGNGRHTSFAYRQWIDGMPVEHGIARILVLKGPLNQVVYAAGTLAPRPETGWPEMTVTARRAIEIVNGFKQYQKLPVFTKPELVVYQGEGEWTAPVRTWKFTGEEPDLSKRERWTFFVDAASGSLIHVRNEVLSDDVTGTMRGMATPGFLPDDASNPPQATAIPLMKVAIVGGNSAYTDATGAFVIPNQGTDPVELAANVGSGSGAGRWVSVENKGPGGLEIGLPTPTNATPGTPVSLVLNQPAGGVNSQTTAQINAFIHTNGIHDFIRSRSGTWDLIDLCLRANVNLNQTCNAFWDGASTNFFLNGGGCVNTAFSDVIRHEYGHFIVQSLELGQGGFGEGFADCAGMLSLDSGPILGRNWMGPGTFVRNVQTAGINYPCSASCGGESHCCGQILGYVWWFIRGNFGTFYGSAPGLAKVQQLFVDWMLVTIGGTGGGFVNSANPTTAIEVLTINDDDGDLTNGTPDYSRICPVFAARSITCPAAPPIGFEFPAGRPTLIPPNTSAQILVNVVPMASTPTPNTGKFDFKINSGSFTEVAMQQLAPNQYRATIPPQPCNTNVSYYFKANAANNTTTTSPITAPADTYYVPVADAILTQFTDSFESDLGWSGSVPSDTATTGRWTRGVPQLTAAQPGADHTVAGDQCWVTDYRAGQQVSDFDVDDGKTTLTSPLINVAGKLSPRISFWLWYSNDAGPTNPSTNTFVIDITNDDGVSWHRAKTLGPGGTGTHGGWKFYAFNVGDFVEPTAQVRVRFIAEDLTDSIVEAAMDDFLVTSLQCPPPFCYANCDSSTTSPILNISDFSCFLNRFQNGESYANCDGSTAAPVLNVQDFTCFLNAFGAGCSS